MKKRVACFYRVSTKEQLDGEDIPLQRNACRKFAQEKDWAIVREYVEKGVSGYKVSEKDRDQIQKAKQDAENGLFDVLLCFMFDRLGRKDDETPFLLKWFSTKNVELWSVKELQQKFESHNDDVDNYIRFWQSSNESKNISIRVDEKHEQMALEGLFRGGKAPHGFKLVPSGVFNKKDKELCKLEIYEPHAKVIREIYNLVYDKGYGGGRIVQYLNEKAKANKDFRSNTGGEWNTGVVNFILRNPVYKGYPTYGKRRYKNDKFSVQSQDTWVVAEKQIKDLVIVKECIWDKVQQIRSSRSPKNIRDKSVKTIRVSKSPLLFVGLIKCGHCGSPLTTTYNTKTYTNKNGETTKRRSAKYRCSGKALGKTDCDGQTIYSQKKIESVVLDEINTYLDQLKKVDFTNEIKKYINMFQEESKLKTIQKELESKYTELSVLKGEVSKSMNGNSAFKSDILNLLIKDKEREIIETNYNLQDQEAKIKDKNTKINDMEALKSYIPSWSHKFESAGYEKKKMMLSYIIDRIVVYRDRTDLKVKLNIQKLIASVNNDSLDSEIDVHGRTHHPQ